MREGRGQAVAGASGAGCSARAGRVVEDGGGGGAGGRGGRGAEGGASRARKVQVPGGAHGAPRRPAAGAGDGRTATRGQRRAVRHASVGVAG